MRRADFGGQADVNREAKLAGPVENDPPTRFSQRKLIAACRLIAILA
jgi:hypothetical protein